MGGGDGGGGGAGGAGPHGRRSSRPVREQEPFATIRAFPRRFLIGVPAVFVLSMGAALPLVGRSLSLAIATQLVIQTTGLLWLYVSALRRRMRGEEEGDGGEGQGS